jgi:simple sugar transport system ATP-binding protein
MNLLEVEASKRYDGRLVLDRARLAVRPGTIHAVVGENGAGKSTLVNIAAGRVRADGGAVKATARIGLVPQHGVLVPTLTVVENAVLGREGGILLRLAPVARALAELGDAHGLAVDPHALAGELSVGEQQRAEIVIALWRGADVLMLDEPTAVLAPVEVEGLFAVLRRHAEGGGAVVLVTHKLDEVVAIADEVTVLRAGKMVERTSRDEGLSAERLARAMVGGEPPGRGGAAAPPGAEPVLEAHGVTLHAGELLGVAGVEGNGQRELIAAATRARAGLGYIPEDRHELGLWLDASVEDNLALGRRELGFVIDRAAKRALAERLIGELDIRPPDRTMPVRALSGGNQQKVVVARELTRPGLRVLVAAQPTRGVDIAAQALIHDRLRTAAGQGVGVLVVSADLDELLGLCHRVAVLYRGRIVGEARPGEAGARDRLGALMTGAA